jgi:hypothetical protein
MRREIEATSVRRRLPVWLLLAVIGLLILAVIAVVQHEPLNATEEQLLGEWTFAASDDSTISKQLVFRSNRTFVVRSDDTRDDGTWELSDGTLVLSMNVDDPPEFASDTRYREFYTVIELTPDKALLRQRSPSATTLELHRAGSSPRR